MTTNTRDNRIRIVNHGKKNWRTEVIDYEGEWAITGPPYATKLEAYSQIDATLAWSF